MDDRAREIGKEVIRILQPYDLGWGVDELAQKVAAAISAYGDERVIAELKLLYIWLKDPLSQINRDDAVDEIARAIDNRRRSLIKTAPEGEKK